ncbi:Ankyrin repeat [Musa troglodytarum]|uniref:Ankyrin repeat n=1 Tax=Musa troglodytarum TaxID=320322 RepID=A0A9E7EWW2_9LILI|nr:Ankyrin repeat [Musa troglodytarum]
MMENSYSKFHAHTGRTTKYRGPPPPSCEGIFPRDYTIVVHHRCFVSRSSTTAHRAEMETRSGIEEEEPIPEGGSESSVLHAAARNGDLTTVESICNANPSPSILEIAIPGHRILSPLFSFPQSSFFVVVIMWWTLLLVQNLSSKQLIAPPRVCKEWVLYVHFGKLGQARQIPSGNWGELVGAPTLHLVAWSGQTVVIRFLCKNKADVGAAMDDTTAIHFAAQGSYYPLARPANRKALTPLHYAVQGSHLELIEYLVRKGASVTAMTKAGQTPIDRVSTEEVRALLVECKQPLTKDDKSTTILEVGDSVSKEHIKENNGGSFAEETANVDEEGILVVSEAGFCKWYGRMESRRIMFSFDVVGPSKCMFHRYRSMASSSQFV